jgi:hypothetical protein
MSEFRNQIPDLINNLKAIHGSIQTDTYYIGLSVTYLTYLYDLLEKEEVKPIKESFLKNIDNEEFFRIFNISEDDLNTFDPYEVYDDICDDITKVVENRMKNLTSDEKYIVIEKLSEQFRFWNVLGD